MCFSAQKIHCSAEVQGTLEPTGKYQLKERGRIDIKVGATLLAERSKTLQNECFYNVIPLISRMIPLLCSLVQHTGSGSWSDFINMVTKYGQL